MRSPRASLAAGRGARCWPSICGDADREHVAQVLDRLALCLPATSLGDVYTIVAYPALASHRDLTPKERARAGIGDGLLRLSAGIEHVDDLIADLAQALAG